MWWDELLRVTSVKKVTHDLKGLLRHHLILSESSMEDALRDEAWQDVRIMAYLHDPDAGDYSLERLGRNLGISIVAQPVAKSHATDNDRIAKLCESAVLIHKAYEWYKVRLDEMDLWELFTTVEMPLSFVLASMERHGMLIDIEYLRQLRDELNTALRELEERIYKLAGERFNIRSPRQLGRVLFEKLQLPHGRRTKTGYSTAADVLEALAPQYEIVTRVLEYRELEKLRSTYVDGLLELVNPTTHRVHTTFDQAGAATGRLSSSEPNLQNIPIRSEWGKRIRRAFIAPSGHVLLSADYSQIELRILAHVSGDEALCNAFMHGEDIHTRTAADVFDVSMDEVTDDMRRRAKVINFGIVYGMSSFGLAQQLGISQDEAMRYIENYFNRYPKVKEYIERTIEHARAHGYVTTLLKRRRYLRGINSTDEREREAAQRAAINMPIQGSAADIIKVAMVRLWSEMLRRNWRAKMILQVHDELVWEV
ncbi:MAG TPA: DNA polymerase I, partial [Armatimonadetes bacterium]|nr:DNA polymerase I [Armatimonadota bacterium]